MSADKNVAVLRHVVEAVNKGNIAALAEFIAPGFIRHDLAAAWPEIAGVEGVQDFITIARTASPDLNLEIEDIFAAGDRAAMRLTIRGTHTGGDLLGVVASGRRLQISAINIYRFSDGKIAETWQLLDIYGFMHQIGGLPSTP